MADAEDERSRRAERGLEILEVLRREAPTRVYVLDDEVPEIDEVDAKLVALARRLQLRLLTNDINLAKVAELQGVPDDHPAPAGRRPRSPACSPGETLHVALTRPGRHPGQGVGFLDDGSMVVVNGGERPRRHGPGVAHGLVDRAHQRRADGVRPPDRPRRPRGAGRRDATSTPDHGLSRRRASIDGCRPGPSSSRRAPAPASAARSSSARSVARGSSTARSRPRPRRCDGVVVVLPAGARVGRSAGRRGRRRRRDPGRLGAGRAGRGARRRPTIVRRARRGAAARDRGALRRGDRRGARPAPTARCRACRSSDTIKRVDGDRVRRDRPARRPRRGADAAGVPGRGAAGRARAAAPTAPTTPRSSRRPAAPWSWCPASRAT